MPLTYEPIATTTLGSAASTITFSSIPSTYTDLRVVINTTLTANGDITFRINNDSSSLYSFTNLYGYNGTNVYTGVSNNRTSIGINSGTTTSSLQPIFATLDVMSYGGSTNKTVLLTSAQDLNGNNYSSVEVAVGLYRSTTAINSITFLLASTTFKIGTTATIYGIKAA
jgi:hypothetical protein